MFENGNNLLWEIILAVVGVYGIINGFKTILTGKLTVREEARLDGYSEKGIKTYKIVYSVINIIAGFICIGMAIVRYLGSQVVIANSIPINIGVLAVMVVLIVVLIVTKSKCKKME